MEGGAREQWRQFGTWLTDCRVEAGLTKAALARAAAISLSTLRSLEFGGVVRGQEWTPPAPKDRTLARLAAALQVDVDEVFRRAGRGQAPADVDQVLDVREKLDLLSLEERGAVEAIVDHLLSQHD